MSKLKIGRYVGSNSPRWKGGYENHLWHSRQRRARILKCKGTHTLCEWNELKLQYNFMCPSCKRSEPEIKLSVDHIMPLKKGGSNSIDNIQPLCKSCNSKKHDKHIIFLRP